MALFGNSPRHDAFVAVALISTVVCSLADVFLLYLIRKMKLWNGHILLILTMSLFQLMYDVTFFPAVISTTKDVSLQLAVEIFQFTGGITSSIFSNCIAFIALYVVYYKSSIDIFRYYGYMLLIALLPCAIISLVYALIAISEDQSMLGDLHSIDMVYCYVRVGSIFANFLMSSYTLKLIRSMASGSSVISRSEMVINVLATRLLYYPVVQALGRSAITVYEVVYGFHFDPKNPPLDRYVAQMMMVCTTPLISVGYLAIFLIMQPHAWRVAGEIFGVKKADDSSHSGGDVDEYIDGGGRYEHQENENRKSLVESSYFSESSHSQVEQLGLAFKDDDLSVNSTQQLRASMQSHTTELHYNFNPLVYDNAHSAVAATHREAKENYYNDQQAARNSTADDESAALIAFSTGSEIYTIGQK
jgi:hypothetical protein